MLRMILAVVAALMFLGCSEQKPDAKDSVYAPQLRALEKAGEVENKLKEGAEKNRRAAEPSEYPAPSGY